MFDVQQWLASGGVILLAAIVFAESGLLVGFFLPGDSLLFIAGFLTSGAGGHTLPTLPLKGDYSKIDIARSARFHGLPFKFPSKFPIAGQAPSRAFYWVNERDPILARKLARKKAQRD